jgi:hypothetical protein
MKMHKFFLLFLILPIFSCSSPDIEPAMMDEQQQEMQNRFQAESYRYHSYDGLSPEITLKSREMEYDNKKSQFMMQDLISRMKSGDDFIYLASKRGIHHIQTKDFDFFEGVRIVFEKKYLLEGPLFKWSDKEKTLKSEPEVPVVIRDRDGLSMNGNNFSFNSQEKKFTMTRTTIIIPEKIAKDEGLD